MSGLGTEVGLGAWRGGLGVWELARIRVRKMFGGLGWKYEWAGMNDIFGLSCSCSSSTQTDTKIIRNNSVTVGWNSNLDSGFSGSSSGFRVRVLGFGYSAHP